MAECAAEATASSTLRKRQRDSYNSDGEEALRTQETLSKSTEQNNQNGYQQIQTDDLDIIQYESQEPRDSRDISNDGSSEEDGNHETSILTRWYLLALYVGNHIGNFRGPVRQDGFWAAVSTFILVLSFGMSVSLTRYITTDREHALPKPLQQLMLIGLMLASIVVMIAMVKYSESLGEPSTDHGDDEDDESDDDDSEDDWDKVDDENKLQAHSNDDFEEVEYVHHGPLNVLRKAIKDKLPIIGIGFFFILGVYMDITKILAHLNCIEIFSTYCHDFLYTVIVNIFFHLFRMVYAAVAVVFTVQFEGIHFYRKWTVHYALLTVAAVTLNLWFDTLLHDFAEVLSADEDAKDQPALNNGTHCQDMLDQSLKNNSGKVSLCLDENTGLYKITATMAPYFYPLTIEFSLLVCEQVAHLLFHMKAIVRPRPIQNSQHMNPSPSVTQENEETHERSGALVPDERTPLLGGSSRNDVTEGSGSDAQDRGSRENGVSSAMFVAIILNAVYILLAVLGFQFKDNDKHKVYYLVVANSFHLVYYLIQSGCLVAGFWLSWRFPSQHLYEESSDNQGGLHVLVVMSSMGLFFSSFISVYACLAYAIHDINEVESTATVILVLLASILDIVALYFQTAFMFHASSVKCPSDVPPENTQDVQPPTSTGDDDSAIASNSTVTERSDASSDRASIQPVSATKRRWFRMILIFLAICNGVTWLVESFITSKTKQDTAVIEKDYYGDTWSVINHVCLPFILFMRFNSCFLFLGSYLDVGR